MTEPGSSDVLAGMLIRSAEDDVRMALDEARELLFHLEQDAEPITPEEVAVLEAVTGSDDAPLEFRSLRRRVDSGSLTWDEFWRRPYDEGQAGVDLVNACVAAAAASMPSLEEIMAEADRIAGESGPRPGQDDAAQKGGGPA